MSALDRLRGLAENMSKSNESFDITTPGVIENKSAIERVREYYGMDVQEDITEQTSGGFQMPVGMQVLYDEELRTKVGRSLANVKLISFDDYKEIIFKDAFDTIELSEFFDEQYNKQLFIPPVYRLYKYSMAAICHWMDDSEENMESCCVVIRSVMYDKTLNTYLISTQLGDIALSNIIGFKVLFELSPNGVLLRENNPWADRTIDFAELLCKEYRGVTVGNGKQTGLSSSPLCEDFIEQCRSDGTWIHVVFPDDYKDYCKKTFDAYKAHLEWSSPVDVFKFILTEEELKQVGSIEHVNDEDSEFRTCGLWLLFYCIKNPSIGKNFNVGTRTIVLDVNMIGDVDLFIKIDGFTSHLKIVLLLLSGSKKISSLSVYGEKPEYDFDQKFGGYKPRIIKEV